MHSAHQNMQSLSPRSCVVQFLFLVLLHLASQFLFVGSFDPLEPQGNITIQWDIVSWTEDGYNAWVTMKNNQQYRHIERPGWSLSWTWRAGEFIWDVAGAEATQQSDCNHIINNINNNIYDRRVPHSCSRRPTMVDLLPEVPYSLRTANCCRGGVLSATAQAKSSVAVADTVANFKLTVGLDRKVAVRRLGRVMAPADFSIGPRSLGYSCGAPRAGSPSRFTAADGRRYTQAIKTWRITCKYSETLANARPRCCVSLSAFYSEAVTACPLCSCGCLPNPAATKTSSAKACSHGSSTVLEEEDNSRSSLAMECSGHMCPVNLHWHVKSSYRGYWKAKLTITNLMLHCNYTDWNVVIQHPSNPDLALVSNFNYTFLQQRNDCVLFWGGLDSNRWLLQAGEMGMVQSEILWRKKGGEFSFTGGWAFPRRVYFNGHECVLPAPDAYPHLPVSFGSRSLLTWVTNWFFLISLIMAIGFVRFALYACTFKFKELRLSLK